MRYDASLKPVFRPLGEAEVAEVARRQSECLPELAEMLENRPSWAPLTPAQVGERLAEEAKKPHTAVFAIYCGDDFVGIGEWSASWDSWSPYAWLIIWPEHRRAGIGKAVAGMLLDKCFLDNPGRSIVTATADWNEATAKFVRSLGFREAGRMRSTHFQEGKAHDTIFFDMLKSEYLSKGRGPRR